MKRIELVETALRALPHGEKITAMQLAERLSLARANVSSDLNKLCADGLAQKTDGRPVYYAAQRRPGQGRTQAEFSFDQLIRDNPSLSHCGELAKAAVLYPPNGMHILLLGETGVGKSMFAACVFRYAAALKAGRRPSALITFNCADYANNPQLLISQLFGVSKGAYTGADRDRAGLLEHADGGILFLDEVHRLPPEGQEMLFTYIDRGVYRRLGEANSERRAQVMLICATTEDPKSALLQTFVRRLPVLIQIPSLAERSLEERMHLISTFLLDESGRLGLPIHISGNSIRALLGYVCPGNAGQLKADIQLVCAKAYAAYLSGDWDEVSITSHALPPHIRNTLFMEKNRKEIWSLTAGFTARMAAFDAESSENPLAPRQEGNDIYEMFERHTADMQRVGLDATEIREGLDSVLDRYYRNFNGSIVDADQLKRSIGPEYLATADKIISTAEQKLGRKLTEDIRNGVAMHLFNAIRRAQQNQPFINPQLERIKAEHSNLFAVAEECLQIVSGDFNISFPPDEAGFLSLFFQADQRYAAVPVEVIVVAHGKGTAFSMAQTANELLGKDVVQSFDMPIDENPENTYRRIREYLRGRAGVREVFMLVDMGSLSDFAEELGRELGIRTETFTLVSTLHVLEAAQKAAAGYPLHTILADTKRVTELALIKEKTAPPAPIPEMLYLLTVCTTGDGSASMLKALLDNGLDLSGGLCKVIALQLADRQEFFNRAAQLEESGRIIAVVSAFSTGLSQPHLSIAEVLDGSALERLQHIVNTETLYLRMSANLSLTLPDLDWSTAHGDIRAAIDAVGRSLNLELTEEMTVGVFCHVAFMLDRLKKKIPVRPFSGKIAFRETNSSAIARTERECARLGRRYQVVIPDDEVCYITALFLRQDFLDF